METEFYKKYRPDNLADVVGQKSVVDTIEKHLTKGTFPHTSMFVGPSGTGKTTTARIVAGRLGCAITNRMDYAEVNCGLIDEPLNWVKRLDRQKGQAAVQGPCRVWVLDEFQTMSRAAKAQEGFLKILEDTPPHVYFIICTTDPKKIIPTIINRATAFNIKAVSAKDLIPLMVSVCTKERCKPPPSKELLEKIAETAVGSPRRALVLLEGAMLHDDPDDRLATVVPTGSAAKAFALVQALCLYGGATPRWDVVAGVLTDIEDEDAEGLRHMILASARSALIKKGHPRAFEALLAFEKPFYDSGNAGLCRAAYDVATAKLK